MQPSQARCRRAWVWESGELEQGNYLADSPTLAPIPEAQAGTTCGSPYLGAGLLGAAAARAERSSSVAASSKSNDLSRSSKITRSSQSASLALAYAVLTAAPYARSAFVQDSVGIGP